MKDLAFNALIYGYLLVGMLVPGHWPFLTALFCVGLLCFVLHELKRRRGY